jgi:hypothetical protein
MRRSENRWGEEIDGIADCGMGDIKIRDREMGRDKGQGERGDGGGDGEIGFYKVLNFKFEFEFV